MVSESIKWLSLSQSNDWVLVSESIKWLNFGVWVNQTVELIKHTFWYLIQSTRWSNQIQVLVNASITYKIWLMIQLLLLCTLLWPNQFNCWYNQMVEFWCLEQLNRWVNQIVESIKSLIQSNTRFGVWSNQIVELIKYKRWWIS